MSRIARLFHPQQAIQLLPPGEARDKLYRYWRLRILVGMFVGYAAYYLTRGTLALAMPQLKEMGYDEVHLGWMITVFQITYGVSKFCNGLLADRANPRYFMALGLILTGVVTLLFGAASSLSIFIILWMLNGWFQGCGSAPCHRLLSHWYSTSERGRWWGVWNTSHNVGAAVLPPIGAIILVYFGWRGVMILPGMTAVLLGFFVMNRLRDTPQSLGLPAIETHKAEDHDSRDEDQELPYREILFHHVLGKPAIWIIAAAYLMVYLMRWTISHWCFFYLVNQQNYTVWQAAQGLWWYEVGGFAGGLAAGWLSDLAFGGRRPWVNLVFFLGLLPCIQVFSTASTIPGAVLLTHCSLAAMGFFVFGPQMLLAVHAAEVAHKKAAATAVGFLGIIAYMGSALTGGPLGYLVKQLGWTQVFLLLQVFAIAGALSCIPLLWASIVGKRLVT